LRCLKNRLGARINKEHRHKIYKNIATQNNLIKSDNIVVNLSDTPLTIGQMAILNKGLNFCITNKNVQKSLGQYNLEIARFIRTLQIKHMFGDSEEEDILKFTGNPEWNPPPGKCSKIIIGYEQFLNKKIKQLFKRNKIKHNISVKDRDALNKLRNNTDILIQKADKGGSITILNRLEYVAKMDKMLADPITYTKVNNIDLEAAKSEANSIIYRIHQCNLIEKKQKNFLTRCTPKLPVLYGLPKIHKDNWPLRPIVSQINSPAYKLNKYLDYLLTTAEKEIPNLLQDTTKFLKIIDSLPNVTSDTTLFTIDVTSLYTVLPHKMVVDYVVEMYQETLDKWNNYTPDIKPIPISYLKEIIGVILKQTFFSFNGNTYIQNYGITMGAPSSVKLANITLHKHLQKATPLFMGKKPDVQLRLIDDIFGLFVGTEMELLQWIDFLNNHHATIKFTFEKSRKEIPFLDTLVYIQDSKIHTTLYKKPTDNKQYLHFNSEHPSHVKKSIPYAQALRYRRIIDDDALLDIELIKLKSSFVARDYPTEEVDKAIKRARALNRKDLLIYKKNNGLGWNATPCILTFSNALISGKRNFNIHKILKESWDDLLLLDPQLSGIHKPKIVFKKCSTLNKILVSTTYPPRQWATSGRIGNSKSISHLTNVGNNRLGIFDQLLTYISKPCGKARCLTCRMISRTPVFTSTTRNTTHKLKNNFDCSSSNVIYLITCKRCDIQYVGETGSTLRERFNNHRSCISLNKLTPIGIHFNSIHHNIKDLMITPIEALSNNNKSDRLIREVYWQLLLGTIFPQGLNSYPCEDILSSEDSGNTNDTDLSLLCDLINLDNE